MIIFFIIMQKMDFVITDELRNEYIRNNGIVEITDEMKNAFLYILLQKYRTYREIQENQPA